MAVVYLAHDEELHRPVAIKLLADNLPSDESFRERFLREARIAAGLAHPNAVTSCAVSRAIRPTGPPRRQSWRVSWPPPHRSRLLSRFRDQAECARPGVATLPLLRHTTAVAARPPEAPLRRGPALRREWLWFAVAAAAVLILIAVALANASGGNAPSAEPLVEPVPGGATPAQRARNLADWLRENSQ